MLDGQSFSTDTKVVSIAGIRALPKDIVDRIAAGEVVQRPVSVVKELIENSMDAGSTCVEIQYCGASLITVTDDGIGIHPSDLPMAAVRFATSKLATFDDLKSIQTFGFRGEALASASMVSKLTIISRYRFGLERRQQQQQTTTITYSHSCAYKQQYRDGNPLTENPIPTAGKIGTTVKVEDLFYNIPSRKRAFEGNKKEIEEYHRILNVAQRYAIHKAIDGVAFVCQRRNIKKSSLLCDLNTQSLPTVKKLMSMKKTTASVVDQQEHDDRASFSTLRENACKEAIGHVFGSSIVQELVTLSCGEGDVENVAVAILNRMRNLSNHCTTTTTTAAGLSSSEFDVVNNSTEYAYRVFGLITNGTYCVAKSSVAFVLFINDRLVECNSIKRAVENIYADTLPKGGKPFIYLSLHLPGPHIDVNVHPTKREVALLFEDRLCEDLSRDVRNLICSASTNKTFYPQPLIPVVDSKKLEPKKLLMKRQPNDVAKLCDKRIRNSSEVNDYKTVKQNDSQSNEPKMTSTLQAKVSVSQLLSDEAEEEELQGVGAAVPHDKMRQASYALTSTKKKNDPKNLIRTNLAAKTGALEPYLVQRTNDENKKVSLECEKQLHDDGSSITFQHGDECEFANRVDTIDISQPGAFTAICRCQIKNDSVLLRKRKLPTISGIPRPKKVIPTECAYTTIHELRNEVASRAHPELTTKLHDSTFVGCISRQRSLIQWGIELLMINHYELSRELFYQLALARFGGANIATLGVPVHVQNLIQQALLAENPEGSQMDDDDPNNQITEQCTNCLRENMEMLNKYFKIRFECEKDGQFYLIGLPVLLDGHSPPPHGLPTFLLRLATEVNWKEERYCFEGICTELGFFYAELPFEEDICNPPPAKNNSKSVLIDKAAIEYVKHTLYPALSFLLAPPIDFATDGTVGRLALLSSLYKVFERC